MSTISTDIMFSSLDVENIWHAMTRIGHLIKALFTFQSGLAVASTYAAQKRRLYRERAFRLHACLEVSFALTIPP